MLNKPIQRVRILIRHIPGFRSGSAASRAVAITYYAAATAIGAVSWPWGGALLALPFLVFALVDLGHTRNRRGRLLTVAVAGAVLVAMAALGLSAQGYRPKTAEARPALAAAVSAAVSVDAAPTPVAPAPSVAEPTATAPAATADAAPTAQPVTLAYVASKAGKVFHLPSCASARNIKPENLVEFAGREEAIAKGLSPCKRCKP